MVDSGLGRDYDNCMEELNLQSIEKVLDKRLKTLAAKKDLEPITQTLSRATAHLAKFSEDFKDFRSDLQNVPATLDSHTTTLDSVYKNTENWKTESMSLTAAIRRHEAWFSQIADKIGVKFEGLER